MNQIMLMLGLNASGLFGGLKRASDEVKGFEKDWRGLQKIFGAGGITYAVIGFFEKMISAAREAKDNITDNYEAVRRFGDSIDQFVNKTTGWFVNLLGWLNRAGEAWGSLVVLLRDNPSDFGASEATEQAAIEVERNLAKAKKHAADFKRINEGLRSEQEKLNEVRLKSLTLQEQFNARENDLFKLVVQRSNYEGDTLGRRELDLKIAQAKTKVVEAEVALNKENAAALKKGFDEDLQWVREHDKMQAELKQAKFDSLSIDQQAAVLAREQSELTAAIAKGKRDGTDTVALEIELQKVINDLGAVRVDQVKKIADAEERARKAAEGRAEAAKMTQKAYEAITFGITNGGHDAQQIQGAEADALRELVSRNNNQLMFLRQNPGSAFDFGNSLQITRLENENRRIQRELDLRASIQRDVGFYGKEGARSFFGGDPLVFDQLVDRFTREQDRTDKQIDILQDIVRRIGPDATGNLPSAVENLSAKIDRAAQSITANLQAANRPS